MVNYLKWGLAGAAIVAIVLFRNQIKNALVGAGQAIGGGVGEAIGTGFGSLVGGIPSGFARGVSSYIPTGVGPSGQTTASPFGIPGPFDIFFRGIPTAYGQQPDETTQTYLNRDQPDLVYIQSKVTQQTYSYPKTSLPETINIAKQESASYWQSRFRQSQLAGAALGHAAAVRQAATAAGVPTPKVTFEAVRQAALREGRTPAQALQIATQSIR